MSELPTDKPTVQQPGKRVARRLKSKAILLLVIAVASALALVSATQEWVAIEFFEGSAASSMLQVSGQQLNPSISPVAIATLASVLALTIAGKRFRLVLGVLVTLLGVGIVTLGVGPLLNPRAESEWSVGEATGIIGDSQYELIRSVSVTTWPSVAIATGAVLALAGIFVLLFGGTWATGGRKYEASSAQETRSAEFPKAPSPEVSPQTPESIDRDRISDWDTMSDGADPTQSP